MSKTGFFTAVLTIFFTVLLVTCNMPLGLGDPVDTIPPTITILEPTQNLSMGNRVINDPVTVSGTWWDNVGVTELRVEIINVRTGYVFKDLDFNYTVNDNGTWHGTLLLPDPREVGELELQIRIIALDAARNQGAATVTIRVDIVPPWIESAIIIRHPQSDYRQELTNINKQFYEDTLKFDFDALQAYRSIEFQNIDYFQNESFTINLRVTAGTFSGGVAATRLQIFDDRGNRLNSSDNWGILPTRHTENDFGSPEWTITLADLPSSYGSAPHYIEFEIWAWNRHEWEGNWDTGSPLDQYNEFSYRKQNIGGTVWYPETDLPNFYIQKDPGMGRPVIIDQSELLPIEVFDDDKLGFIYAALVDKNVYLNLRGEHRTDSQFHEQIRIDPIVRNQVISEFGLLNLNTNPNTRNTVISLSSNVSGEYRLILFASDDKSVPPFSTVGTPVWNVYPPLAVDVQNPNAPIIIIEKPEIENSFPNLDEGRKFELSGYTIDQNYTQFVQIAWIPAADNQAGNSRTISDARSAFLTTRDNPVNAQGAPYIINDFRIWKLDVGANLPITLNNLLYTRNDFSKVFDILDDFKLSNGSTENAVKLFYIQTVSFGGVEEIRTFRLTAFLERPALAVNYPVRDEMIHDTNSNLELRMTITPGKVGLKDGWEGIRIRDITETGLEEARRDINAQDPGVFSGGVLSAGNVHTRTIFTDDCPSDYFDEGSRKVYLFEAEDILGNITQIERKVRMSSTSSIMYLNCSNAEGIYGIDKELIFEAVFSMPIEVIRVGSGPRLKLFFNDPGLDAGLTPHIYADFLDSAGTSIRFRYIVKAGDNAQQLYTAVDSIDLNGSSIMFNALDGSTGLAVIVLTPQNHSTGSLQVLKEIGINGVQPIITGASFLQTSPIHDDISHAGSSYFNSGKTLTLELRSDKAVRVSGTPEALISWEGGIAWASFSSLAEDNFVIRFTWDVGNMPLNRTQVRWGQGTVSAAPMPWIRTTDGNITDIFENPVNLSVVPSGGLLDGSSLNPQKRAFIITNRPIDAQVQLYNNSNLLADALIGSENVFTNAPVYLRNTRLDVNDYTIFWYSLAGGGNPMLSTTAFATLADDDFDNRNNTTYTPSVYAVTAWYEDFAGNRSASNTAVRTVTINSRSPELVAINCMQPNGRYAAGRELTFNLVFSRPVIAGANARVIMDLQGTGLPDRNTITGITQNFTAGPIGTTLSVNFEVPSNRLMANIKATRIVFENLTDEFGNPLKIYDAAAVTEDASSRPLAALAVYNLNRPLVIIESIGPQIVGWSPGAVPDDDDDPYDYETLYPNGISPTGMYSNGGILPEGERTIKLEFDKQVFAQAGGQIIVRPYGQWGLPPVLDIADFDRLFNSVFMDISDPFNPVPDNRMIGTISTTEEYRRRLRWLDSNGLPERSVAILAPGDANNNAAHRTAMLTERNRYNFYTYTTRGLVNTGGRVRPDTTAQWVLAFRHDIYEGVDRLREVFNAAQWNWQRVLSTSTTITTDEGVSTVTITLPEELPKGRIWEVIIQEGAFRDGAGNESVALEAGRYRFWSDGTETPVIRVDRYSHGEHFHGVFDADSNFFDVYGIANRPKIDTRIRIDCETPGASIHYDTIRTSFTPRAAGTGTDTSVVFSTFSTPATGTPYNTGATFFDHININAGATIHPSNTNPGHEPYTTRGANPGFANNWIGNSGSHHDGTQQDIDKDDNGFIEGLLVPNTIDGVANNALVTAGNGAIEWSSLQTRGNNVLTAGRVYRTIQDDETDFEYGAPVFVAYTDAAGRISTTPGGTAGRFFYVGDAYRTVATEAGLMTHRDTPDDSVTDSRLFSGRRDYVVAAAVKNNVNTGTFAGPALDASERDMEGVFKTTVLHRNPNGRTTDTATFPATNAGSFRMYIQGFDLPVNTTVAGFPINESTVPFPVAGNSHLDYFTRQPWRLGTIPDPPTQATARANNNYIWVTWDIVTDWYHKGRLWGYNVANTTFSGASLNRDGKNYGAILCTYGAVTYRFEQKFWGGPDFGFR
jgi:hypothetical protein